MRMYAAALARLRPRHPPGAEEHPPREYDGPSDTKTPPHLTLVPLIDHLLVKLHREGLRPYLAPPRADEPRARRVVHPSQAGGCQRALGFSVLDLEQEESRIDAKLARVFDVGHLVHRRLQGYLWSCKLHGKTITRMWEDTRLSFSPLLVSGELDCIVELEWRDRYVVEIKSINRDGYDGLSKPKETWVWQAYLYMLAMNLRGAVILVECKDTQRLRDFYIPFNAKQAYEIVSIILRVLNLIRNRQLPQVNTAHCHFCGYKTYCDVRKGKTPIDWSAVDEIDWTEVIHATAQAHDAAKEAVRHRLPVLGAARDEAAPQTVQAPRDGSTQKPRPSYARGPGRGTERRAVTPPGRVYRVGKLPARSDGG